MITQTVLLHGTINMCYKNASNRLSG